MRFRRRRRRMARRLAAARGKGKGPFKPDWTVKTPDEITRMRESGRIVAEVHRMLADAIRPGMSTLELDDLSADFIAAAGGSSAFLGYQGFPGHTCISVNEELVHGIPAADRILREGDIVSIDVGVVHDGFIGDRAWTYPVGEIGEKARHLLQATEDSLYAAIQAARVGGTGNDIARAIVTHVHAERLQVVREYTSHGVGRQLHEPPQLLHFLRPHSEEANCPFPSGLTVALEPMVQIGTWRTRLLRDEWTVISQDRSLSAHFEHTVAITDAGPQILTCL